MISTIRVIMDRFHVGHDHDDGGGGREGRRFERLSTHMYISAGYRSRYPDIFGERKMAKLSMIERPLV